jgi:uncharacterized protein (TIGR02302 family)
MAQRGEGVNPPDPVRPAQSNLAPAQTPFTTPLERRLAYARAALFWERFWPALMPAAAVIAVFFILAGFDIWRFTPVWLHWLLLAGFASAFAFALWRELQHLRWPDRAAAMRRLERVNLLQHRPLEAAADTLSAEQQDPIARALWAIHRERALAQLAKVRVGTPEAGWWRKDVWGFRAALGLLLVVAWASPGEDRRQRLSDTLNPGTAMAPGMVLAMDAWITPPPYTGKPPLFLTRDGKAVPGNAAAPLTVPTGSLLKLRLSAPPAGFALKFGKSEQALQPIDERNGEIDLALDLTQGAAPVLSIVRRDKVVAEWPLQMIPDLPPQIEIAGEPKTSRRNELEVGFTGHDDYGLQQVRIQLTRDGAEQSVSLDWPTPPAGAGEVQDKQSFDFTSHPWAGLQVQMTLVATDAVGQTGRSQAVTVTIPARRFIHPVAKAIVEQRRELALKPGQWQRVVTALRGLSLAPERYRGDATAHLGLRMSSSRLSLNRSPDSIAAVQELLWQTALHIEEGRKTQTDKDFQALMDKLQDALDRNADDSEIQKLMQEMREAMNRMLEQLMQDAMERLARGEEPEELGEDEEAMSGDDLQDMMDQAQDMAQMGDRDAARDMLQQMQRMMEALKNGPDDAGIRRDAAPAAAVARPQLPPQPAGPARRRPARQPAARRERGRCAPAGRAASPAGRDDEPAGRARRPVAGPARQGRPRHARCARGVAPRRARRGDAGPGRCNGPAAPGPEPDAAGAARQSRWPGARSGFAAERPQPAARSAGPQHHGLRECRRSDSGARTGAGGTRPADSGRAAAPRRQPRTRAARTRLSRPPAAAVLRRCTTTDDWTPAFAGVTRK